MKKQAPFQVGSRATVPVPRLSPPHVLPAPPRLRAQPRSGKPAKLACASGHRDRGARGRVRSPQPPGSPARPEPSRAALLGPTRGPHAAPHGTARTTTLTTHGLLRVVCKLTGLQRGGAERRGHVKGVFPRRGPTSQTCPRPETGSAPELLAPPPPRSPAPAYNYLPSPAQAS